VAGHAAPDPQPGPPQVRQADAGQRVLDDRQGVGGAPGADQDRAEGQAISAARAGSVVNASAWRATASASSSWASSNSALARPRSSGTSRSSLATLATQSWVAV
jgi:hypothetical protein